MNSRVRYRNNLTTKWIIVRILGRGGKIGGKYQNFINVEFEENKEKDCID